MLKTILCLLAGNTTESLCQPVCWQRHQSTGGRVLLWLLTVGLFVLGQSAGVVWAEETPQQKYIVSIERIWDRAEHAAFTDLIRFRGQLYCTFREGTGHIPGRNGLIRVLRSRDAMNWESVALLDEPHVDLRDPKLSITRDNRLMVNSGASYYHDTKRLKIESRVAFSDEHGENFSAPVPVQLPEEIDTGMDWLWRITWHEGWAWGCVQQVPSGQPRSLQLVRSRDGIRYELVSTMEVSQPSETTLRFEKDGTLRAMIRRAGREPVGWLGTASAPYTDWKFTPTNKQFGGPNFIPLDDQTWLAGSRQYGDSPTTALWWLDPQSGKFTDLLTFPSGGDNSYPGFVVDRQQQRLYVSYYSSHEGHAAIYLAILRLDALLNSRN